MLQRTNRFKVIFDEDLKKGYTFDIDLEDLRSLTTEQIVAEVFKKIRRAGVTVEVDQFLREVERSQKYYVDLDTAAYVAKWNGDGSVQIYTDSVSGSDEYELHLTEQEIKDYDDRFWPFAVPVEVAE